MVAPNGRTLTEAAGQSGRVEYYHNHAWQAFEERFLDGDEQLQRVCQNVWSPRYIDAMVLRDACDPATGAIILPERLFYLADANYNVTGLVREHPQNPGRWQIVERSVYDPYGRATLLQADWSKTLGPDGQPGTPDDGTTSNFATTTLYTGRTLDLESGLYHYRARHYHPLLSTFTARDPIGYWSSDANLYRYVRNQPVLLMDPSGHVDYGYVHLEGASYGKAPQVPVGHEWAQLGKAVSEKTNNTSAEVLAAQ